MENYLSICGVPNHQAEQFVSIAYEETWYYFEPMEHFLLVWFYDSGNLNNEIRRYIADNIDKGAVLDN